MGKKLLILACVVLLVGAVGLSNVSAEELAYDDGGWEDFIFASSGAIAAVVFTPNQYPAILKQVRLHIGAPNSFRLHVYGVPNINAGPSLDLIPSIVQIPTVEGWHTVDLSIYNITINPGEHFAIGLEWLINDWPDFMVDLTPPVDNRSWFWDGINWNLLGQVLTGYNGDLMVRATVEPAPTTTTTSIDGGGQPSGILCRLCPVACGLGADSEETELMRAFRDEVLSKTAEGREIIKLYYQWGPLVARAMEADEEFKEEVTEIIEAFLPMARDSVE